MARNFPGPYELEYTLLINGRTSLIRYSVVVTNSPSVGAPLSDFLLRLKNTTTRNAQQCANDFWSRARALYNSGVSCTGVTLWRYRPNSLAKDYMTAAPVTNPNGLSNQPTNLGGQVIMTFRSGAGGIAKLVFLETPYTSNGIESFSPTATTPHQLLAQYAVSGDSPIVARDNGFLVTGIRILFGQNEAIWRRRFRP